MDIVVRALAFYIIPLLIGRSVYKVARFFHHDLIKKRPHWYAYTLNTRIYSLVYYYAVGVLSLFVSALFTQYILGNVFNLLFGPSFYYLVGVLCIASSILTVFTFPDKLFQFFKKGILPFLVITTISLSVTVLWWHNSPLVLNWDWYQHQVLVTYINRGEYSFFTSDILDTFGFNSYPPVFHTVMAVTQYGMPLDSVTLNNYWQIISIFHLISAGIASWVIAKALFNNRYVSVISTLMGILIFDSSVSFTNLFLLPQTLAAVVFTMLFAKVLDDVRKNKVSNGFSIIIGCLFLVSMHYIVGGLGAAILLIIGMYSFLQKHKPHFVEEFLIVPGIIALAIGGMILSTVLDLGSLNRGEAALYIFDLPEKLEFLQHGYGYFLYFWLLMGLVALILNNQFRTHIKVLLFVLLGLMAVLLSQFPYVLKFFTLAKFLIQALMAYGVYYFIEKTQYKISKIAIISLLIPSLLFVLVLNLYYWKSGLLYKGLYTHQSAYDLEASNYIRENFDWQTTMIFSDPATQFILEGLSGIDSPGGAYISKGTRDLLISALETDDPASQFAYFAFLRDQIGARPQTRILALSGRTFAWLNETPENQLAFNFNHWSPLDLSPNDIAYARKFATHSRVEIVYENPYLILLKLN